MTKSWLLIVVVGFAGCSDSEALTPPDSLPPTPVTASQTDTVTSTGTSAIASQTITATVTSTGTPVPPQPDAGAPADTRPPTTSLVTAVNTGRGTGSGTTVDARPDVKLDAMPLNPNHIYPCIGYPPEAPTRWECAYGIPCGSWSTICQGGEVPGVWYRSVAEGPICACTRPGV
jgi:hypothetical protein